MEPRLVELDRPANRLIQSGLLEAGARQEVFRRTCAVVLDLAQTWGDEGLAIMVLSPPLTRADVQSAFDEISEKFSVAGIELRFGEHESGCPQAVFEAHGRSAAPGWRGATR